VYFLKDLTIGYPESALTGPHEAGLARAEKGPQRRVLTVLVRDYSAFNVFNRLRGSRWIFS